MVLRTVHINDWTVDVFFCRSHYDERVLGDALAEVDAPISITVRMREIARDDEYNTGFTYSNNKKRRSVMVVGKATTPAEFLNSFCHELRHLTDDIAYEDRIGMRGEAVGYLQGGIGRELADLVGLFLCPKCSRKRLI